MKKLSIITLFALVFIVASCTKVKEPFVKETKVEGKKVVLLEDFTGVRCINCPDAHEIAEDLLARYSDNLVVISIHAGSQASPLQNWPDFTTEAGDTWYYNTFNFDHNPVGTINRTKNDNGGYGFDDGLWGTKVVEEIAKEQEAETSITPSYNSESRELSITLHTTFKKEIEGDYFIFAGLLEDSVQGKQVTHSGLNPNYWHRNMFRAPINGTWGQRLYNGLTEINQEFETNLSITVDTTYREDQCYVVSYVYDNNDRRVIQACKAKIK